MNWFMNIIIYPLLLGQVLSDLSCKKSEICSCLKHAEGKEITVTCNSSTLEANTDDSNTNISIQCMSDQVRWDRFFDQINVKQLVSKNCPSDERITQTMSTLGVKEIQKLILINMKLNDSLKSFYLSNLEMLKILGISSTKLVLTNESFEGTPNLTNLNLRGNYIGELPKRVFKHLSHLEVLDLAENKISKIDNDLFVGIPLKKLYLGSNELTTLNLYVPSLTLLDVSGNSKINSINVDNMNKLTNITLNKNTLLTMSDEPFKNTSLRLIKYNYGNLTKIPINFLTDLNRLSTVYLTSSKIEKVPENMIWNSTNITELLLTSNRIKELPAQFFRDSQKLKVLNLSKNQIVTIDRELLKPLKNLVSLDLSFNLIFEIDNFGFNYLKSLENLFLENNNIVNIDRKSLYTPRLKKINLAYNKISQLTNDAIQSFAFDYANNLEDVDLSHNNISSIDLGWVNLVILKNVNLTKNNFTSIGMGDIQYLNQRAIIHFEMNPLKTIDLSGLIRHVSAQSDYSGDIQARHLYLSGNNLICDCHNYDFSKYVQNQMPDIVYKYVEIKQNLNCTNNTEFKSINMNSLACEWKDHDDPDKIECYEECKCSYRPHDNVAIMNCSNRNLTSAPETIISAKHIHSIELDLRNNHIAKLPNYEHLNIRKLDVGYNNLTTINITQLPKDLMELNVEHNYLKRIGETNASVTLSNLKSLALRGNSWECGCEAKSTIDFVRKYSSKIVDLENITCPSSTLLYKLSVPENCQDIDGLIAVQLISISIFLAVFGIVSGVLMILFSSYKTEIKIWLYSHNITWPISEESLDQDKKYDAFISFSHKDEELVAKHLVPGLEGDKAPFKLCLHYRDWVVGDWIPAQIARSVDESRRTIIVLSQNFLDSVWGRTEFRTAYSSALNERRSRIIVILYGDISTKDLDPELKAYLSMNTYIKWGDYWFWEKLKYALPHRPDSEKKIKTNILVPDKLNPLKLK